VTGCSLLAISVLGIAHVDSIERSCHRIGFHGHCDEVYMIAHEAISPDLHSVLGAIGFEPIEVKNTIRIRLENALAVIAPLGNVVRKARSDSSGDPWHGGDNRMGRERKSRK
jgi:hypothetical protein